MSFSYISNIIFKLDWCIRSSSGLKFGQERPITMFDKPKDSQRDTFSNY